MKKLLIGLFALGLISGATGCTSSTPEEQPSDAAEMAGDTNAEISEMASDATMDEVSGDDFGDFGDEVVADGGAAAGESMDAMAGDDMAMGEPAGDMAAGDMGSDIQEPVGDTDTSLGDDLMAESAAGDALADSALGADSGMPADEMAGIGPTDDMGTTTDSSLDSSLGPSDDTYADSTYSDSTADTGFGGGEMADTSSRPSLNKMITTPYRKSGILVNAIYIARPGDTMDSVSQKIYGSDRVDELKTVNGHLASRDLVVGDKIYYNSPRRPADETSVLTYYEDAGLTPETYVSQPGDNIRAVGKTLLGDAKSWKELWATNMEVESKDILPEGTRLRYWSSDMGASPVTAPAPTMAQVEEQMPPPQEEVPAMPDAPEMNQAANDMAAEIPPPPMEEPIQPPPQEATIAEAPPPPPPVELPPPAVQADADAGAVSGDDTTALIAGAILLLVAVVMVIVIRKRKAKKNIDFQTATHTQLE